MISSSQEARRTTTITNSILNLDVNNSANYLFDIDSLVSIGCFISTAKTSLSLRISFTLVGLSMAPLSFTNHGKFDLITSILQWVAIQLRRKLNIQGTGL